MRADGSDRPKGSFSARDILLQRVRSEQIAAAEAARKRHPFAPKPAAPPPTPLQIMRQISGGARVDSEPTTQPRKQDVAVTLQHEPSHRSQKRRHGKGAFRQQDQR